MANSITACQAVVENSPHIMKYWKDHASHPFQSHELWFLTEDIRWGKFEPTLDTQALIKKVNFRKTGKARRRKNPGRCGRRDSGVGVARRRNILDAAFDPANRLCTSIGKSPC